MWVLMLCLLADGVCLCLLCISVSRCLFVSIDCCLFAPCAPVYQSVSLCCLRMYFRSFSTVHMCVTITIKLTLRDKWKSSVQCCADVVCVQVLNGSTHNGTTTKPVAKTR